MDELVKNGRILLEEQQLISNVIDTLNEQIMHQKSVLQKLDNLLEIEKQKYNVLKENIAKNDCKIQDETLRLQKIMKRELNQMKSEEVQMIKFLNDEKLMKYFNRTNNSFIFKTVNNKQFELTPPNIGIQKAFTEYIVKENNENKQPNLSFLKIIPFMLGGRNSITYDGIKAKLTEFEQLDDISFQFLNAAVGKMTFGIKELVKPCSACGVEVRAEMQFPNGASGIFVIHDAFEAFIKE